MFLNSLIRKVLSKIPFYSRKEWQKHLSQNSYDDPDWEKNSKRVKENILFFQLFEYKPSLNNDFKDELKYLQAALSYANYCYCNGNVLGYRKNISLIGKYLEHAVEKENYDNKNNQYVNTINNHVIYQDYLHGKATIEAFINNNPALAANLNLEASRKLSKYPHFSIQSTIYENCSLCARIESLATDESKLLVALDATSNDIIKKINQLKDSGEFEKQGEDYAAKIFDAYVLKCKMELYKTNPDFNIIEKYILLAAQSRNIPITTINNENENTNLDSMNQMVVYFYLSYAYMLKNDYENAKKYYKLALKQKELTQTPYYCLIRVPDEKLAQIANYVQLPKFTKDLDTSKYHELNRSFQLNVYFLLFITTIVLIIIGILTYTSSLTIVVKRIFFSVIALLLLLVSKFLYEKNKEKYELLLDENSKTIDNNINKILFSSFGAILTTILTLM